MIMFSIDIWFSDFMAYDPLFLKPYSLLFLASWLNYLPLHWTNGWDNDDEKKEKEEEALNETIACFKVQEFFLLLCSLSWGMWILKILNIEIKLLLLYPKVWGGTCGRQMWYDEMEFQGLTVLHFWTYRLSQTTISLFHVTPTQRLHFPTLFPRPYSYLQIHGYIFFLFWS